MKCDVCKNAVEETFLKKVKGAYLVRGKKKMVVCPACQGKYSIDELKKKVGF